MVAEANGNIFKGKEKVAQLQLYVQDILTGPSPSNVQVAAARSTSTSPTFFGLVAVIDDPVRTAPSPEAEIVGRAQGFFAFASLEEISIHMTFDLVFTGGKYNGSTLNLVGRNPYPRDHRELSVVGGSGVFRLARGYVGVTTVSMNSANGDAFFQYNITVLHY
ncbi:dirigent protein 21 [Phtheirospermum japonicum]|uniref:Dirigent protein n=1 Tax=Phtheirospermum japonicum TaxID=374723 RepID=A0A830BSN3_9LAMI|nr:dirigent protein 21 [Phtheirospermum japonicum]